MIFAVISFIYLQMKIIISDNNDSFTHNLAHLVFRVSGFEPEVIPWMKLEQSKLPEAGHLFISPGPGCPAEYPLYSFITALHIPVTGICLGMQILNEIHGGQTMRAPEPVHGKTDTIIWQNNSYTVARYHSLYCGSVAECFDITAENTEGLPMIIRHKTKPFTGFQFHPESFLTEKGEEFVRYALAK